MLDKLDDKIELIESSQNQASSNHSLSNVDNSSNGNEFCKTNGIVKPQITLPQQLIGEPIEPCRQIQSLSNEELSSSLTKNTLIGARPVILKSNVRRVSLSKTVEYLVCQWSLGFLSLALENDGPSQFLIAQMFLSKNGYGCVRPNYEIGIIWLFKAIENNNLEARIFARKRYLEKWNEYLKRKGLNDVQNTEFEAELKYKIETDLSVK